MDISVQKSKELNDKLLLRMDSKQIILVDPMAGYCDDRDDIWINIYNR